VTGIAGWFGCARSCWCLARVCGEAGAVKLKIQFGRGTPRKGRAWEVSAENQLDVFAGVVSPDYTFREIVNLLCVVNTVKVEFPCRGDGEIPSYQIDIAP